MVDQYSVRYSLQLGVSNIDLVANWIVVQVGSSSIPLKSLTTLFPLHRLIVGNVVASFSAMCVEFA